MVPNMQHLQTAFRLAGVEVIYTTIESLIRDGRVIDAIAPAEDEIVLPKTSSSVFVSTSIDYMLRNLGIRQRVVSGLLTDQCVESAVRDACDLGYLVTLVTDVCMSITPERHDNSPSAIRGYCRQITTNALIAELQEVSEA